MIQKGWRARWIAWRNSWLSNPAFQRWAADFPLTRGVARRRSAALFDLVSGFVYSQTLAAALRVGLLDRLAEGAGSIDSLASAIDLSPDAAERLLGACAALGLSERAGDGQWALGAQGAALRGASGLSDMIRHQALLYSDLSRPEALLRSEGPGAALAGYWPYASGLSGGAEGPAAVAPYSRLMAATQPAVAADILDAYDIGRHKRLLDVGGGDGAFLAAAAIRAPALRLDLLDLPGVTDLARRRFGESGLLDRIEIHTGDFLTGSLPRGADLITLIRILHDHDDAGVDRLLREAREALAPGGALLIAEPMSEAPRRDRVSDVYFAFYLLAMGRGRARTPADLIARLKAAGFSHARRIRTRSPHLLRAIVAHP